MILLNKKNNRELSCDEARELMFEYLDGQTSDKRTRRLQEHLDKCPDCRAELAERKRMLGLIQNAGRDVPGELFPNVMKLVASTPQNKKNPISRLFSRGYMPIGTIAAACAVIMIMVVSRAMLTGVNKAADNASGSSHQLDAMWYYAPEMSSENSWADSVANNNSGNMAPSERSKQEPTDDGAVFSGGNYDTTSVETYTLESGTFFESEEDVGAAAPELSKMSTSNDLRDKAMYEMVLQQYTDNKSGDSAVVICSSAALDGVVSELNSIDEVTVNLGETEAEVVVYKVANDKSEDSFVEFTSYLTLLESNDNYYESYVPDSADFDSYYILLVSESAEENEAVSVVAETTADAELVR